MDVSGVKYLLELIGNLQLSWTVHTLLVWFSSNQISGADVTSLGWLKNVVALKCSK